MNAIEEKTGIPMALEGIFKGMVFLVSKREARVPAPNQYFDVFQDGTRKNRGIELRRWDTTNIGEKDSTGGTGRSDACTYPT